MLVIGTDAGQVILLQFLYEELQQYTKSKGNTKNTIDLDAFARNHKATSTLTKRKAHSDWCVKVRYYSGIRSIISCSADPKESLVVATHNKNKWTYNSLPVHKGVNTFAYCSFPAVLVTGGTGKKNCRIY